MSELKATNALALKFLITEDLYLLDEMASPPVAEPLVQEEEVTEAEAATFDYLGENNKYFLLLVSEANHPFMAPKELEALKSILTAKKLELKDVAIVNLKNYPGATFSQLKAFFALSKLVLFGIDPRQIQLPALSANKITEFEGSKILSTYSFSEMLDSVEKKKTFWGEMKNL